MQCKRLDSGSVLWRYWAVGERGHDGFQSNVRTWAASTEAGRIGNDESA